MPTQQTFDGPTLEGVLSRVGAELGPAPRIVAAEKVRRGGVGGFFARESFEVTVEVDDDEAGSAPPAGTPPAPAAGAPTSIADLADRVSDHEQRTAVAWPAMAGTPASLPASFSPSTEGRTFQEVLRGLLADTVPAAPAHDVDVAPLTALGVPEDLLATGRAVGAGATPAARLLAVLEQLPAAPPLRAGAGDVIVVAGDPAVAAEAAACAAAELGHVPVELLAACPEQAAAQSRSWRDRLLPTVAVLGCGYDPRAQAEVRALVSALRPAAVWGAVRADRKPEDVAAWARGVAVVTALAVGSCEETTTPAAVLGTGLPVAVIDGRRATPAAWTALLVERLAVR